MDDKEFEPTIEMMIHDFDDEQTLEEEERQAAAEANQENELDQLQKVRNFDLSVEKSVYRFYFCFTGRRHALGAVTRDVLQPTHDNTRR